MCSVSTPDSPIKLAHLNLKLSMETATSELCFDTARLDLAERRLLIDDVPARLGARAFDILVALIERRDRVVGRSELFQVVWPNVVVEESNLQVHISALRKLLGAQAIATIPGRGYRFTAKLAASPNDAAAPIPKAHSQAPAESGPLYGRDEDLRAIDALMQRHRLVSIVGASGIGKTQLAQVIAARQRDNFPNEIYWVELAPLNNEALVIDAIAQALKVQASDERPVLETIVALLRNQNVLLALDNCEHLLDAAAGVHPHAARPSTRVTRVSYQPGSASHSRRVRVSIERAVERWRHGHPLLRCSWLGRRRLTPSYNCRHRVAQPSPKYVAGWMAFHSRLSCPPHACACLVLTVCMHASTSASAS